MAHAYIHDHVRTLRGKGRPDGALSQITQVQLSAPTLVALRQRNNLDTSQVGDVILGCVAPIGEQGANLGRLSAIVANYDQAVRGQQIKRFCASALEAVNLAAAVTSQGQADAVVAGAVESMSLTRSVATIWTRTTGPSRKPKGMTTVVRCTVWASRFRSLNTQCWVE